MSPAEAQDRALADWVAASLAYLKQECSTPPWNDAQDSSGERTQQ